MKLKKILSLLLAMSMLFSCVGITAMAEEADAVALIAGADVYVTNLNDAFTDEYNPNQNSVILLKDCDQDVDITSEGAYSFYLNGHTLTGSFKLSDGVVNFNGSLAGTTEEGADSVIQNTGLDGNYPLWCERGNFNLAGDVKVIATEDNGTAIYSDGSKMTITGAVDVEGNVETGAYGIISITKGTYNGTLIKGTDSALEVVGGTFSEDPSAFIPDGYEAVLEDGVYTVKAKEVSLDDLTSEAEGVYLISTPQDVVTFRTLLNTTEGKNILSGVVFKVTEDIDMDGITLAAAGSDSKRFMGTFDGQNHKISNVNIQAEGTTYVAFFGNISGATIKDITLHNLNVVGGSYTAGLVGFTRNSTIDNCAITGNIDISGTSHVGGIHAGGVVTITDCEVSGTGTISGSIDVGAISGLISEGSTAVTGNSVSGITVEGDGLVGGLIGRAIVGSAGLEVSGNSLENVSVVSSATAYTQNGLVVGSTQAANGTATYEDNATTDSTLTVAGEVSNVVYCTTNFDGTDYNENVDTDVSAPVTYVAEVNGTKYTSLEGAFAAAESGDTITLVSDVTTGADITIKKNITLDLGGKTITDAYIKIYAEVEIKNGSIKNTQESYPLVVEKGKLTVDGVAIEASKSDRAIWVRSGELVFNSGSILATKGENNTTTNLIAAIYTAANTDVTINDGTITVDTPDNKAIGIYGNYANANVTVNGGKISTNGDGYNYGINVDGDITVNGGEIVTNEKGYGYDTGVRYGKNYALVTATGDVTITGGTITTNGPSGYIVNVGRTYSSNAQTVTITGGTMKNDLSEVEKTKGNQAPVLVYEGSASPVTATVTNGSFSGFSANLLSSKNEGTTLTVSGGTFENAPAEEYLAEGFNLKENADGTYGVEDSSVPKVATVNGVEYTSVAEALLAAARDGAAEVKILSSVKELLTTDLDVVLKADLTITADSAVTVDFYNNGTTYDLLLGGTNGEDLTIAENVTLTVSDRIIWVGYHGNNIDVIVNGSLIGGYQLWFGADVTVSETGTVGSKGEALVGRRNATLAINGGNLEANYFSLISGTVELNNTTATTGPLWLSSNAEGAGHIVLNNSSLTSKGNLKMSGGASVTVTDGSTLNLTSNEYGDSVIGEGCTLTIDTSSSVTSNAITGTGAINIDASDFNGTAIPVLNTAGMSGFTGNVSVVNNGNADYEIGDDGKITIIEKAVTNVAEVNGVGFETLAEAFAAANSGDEILLLANVEGDITVPANVIFNGNGFTVSGGIIADGDITFAGITKAKDFDVNYVGTTINIGSGATLELTGTDRMVIGHGCTFNIEGNITDAKTANTADLAPSLIVAAGASFTGTNLTFNVTNAYIKFNNSSTSKNSNANGTFNFNITNSIWEQTKTLVFSEPTNGKDPTFNFNLKDSVLNSTTHLVFAVTKGDIVIDNSYVNKDAAQQLENRSNLTIKNGSVVHAKVATSENAKNPGTTIVDNATYTTTGEFSGSDLGTGTLIVKNGAKFSTGKITKANITIDAAGLSAGEVDMIAADLSKFEGTVRVVNNNLEAKIEDGKIVLVTKPVAKIGDTEYATLEEAFKAATDGCTIDILDDVVIDYKWDCRDYATNGSHSQFKESVTINGNNHTIKFTNTISDSNWNTVFRFEENAIVKDLTIDISEATGTQRVITAKKSLDVDNLTIIGSAKYGIIFGEGASAEDLANAEISIANSNLNGTRRAISDNEGGKDVKTVKITGNTLNADVYVSALETVTFTDNNMTGGYVDIRSYTANNALNVTAIDNTLTENTDTNYNYIKAGGTVNAQKEFIIPATGSNSPAFTKEVDGYVRVWGEGGGNAKESFVLKLYSGDTLMATTELNNVGGIINGDVYVTWNFYYPESNDDYWTTTWEEGHPNALDKPTKVELYIDGTLVSTTDAQMNGPDNLNPVIWENLGGVKEAELPNADVTVLEPLTLKAGSYMVWPSGATDIDRPLEIVMNFKTNETTEEARPNGFLDWKVDFYLDFEGLATGSIKAENCYLAGNYGSFGWIVIPTDDLVIEEGITYPVVAAYDANITYKQICDEVKNFTAAIHVDQAILDANPNFKVKLSLKMTNPDDASDTLIIGEPAVYTAEDLKNEKTVAQIGTKKYSSLADAIAAAQANDTIVLLDNIELSETVTVPADKTITLDLNGKTITGTDNNTSGNFYLISVNKGNLTVIDNVGDGKITLEATNERNWNSSSVVIANNQGTLTVNGGAIEHLGGTSMAYGIDNLTNGDIGAATTTINGGSVDSTYFAVRQFANSATTMNTVEITGGDVGYVWMQSPNDQVNTVTTTISGGMVDGLCVSGVNADYTLSALASSLGESKVYGTMPAGKVLAEVDGIYTLEEEKEEVELFDFYTTTVTLDNSLAINFYVEDKNISGENYTAKIEHTLADGTVNKVEVPYSEWGTNSKGYYSITYSDLVAVQMADEIRVAIYNSDGVRVSEEKVDGIRAYAIRGFNKFTDPTLLTALADMLNYGAAAQIKFNYNVDDLATSGAEDFIAQYASQEITVENIQEKGENYLTTTLSLENNILLTGYFRMNDITGKTATIEYVDIYNRPHSTTVTSDKFVKNSETIYGICVDDLAIADAGCAITITVYNQDGTVYGTLVDSMNSYLYRIMQKDDSDIYKMVAKFTSSAAKTLN